jgi:hypothetical protein
MHARAREFSGKVKAGRDEQYAHARGKVIARVLTGAGNLK